MRFYHSFWLYYFLKMAKPVFITFDSGNSKNLTCFYYYQFFVGLGTNSLGMFSIILVKINQCNQKNTEAKKQKLLEEEHLIFKFFSNWTCFIMVIIVPRQHICILQKQLQKRKSGQFNKKNHPGQDSSGLKLDHVLQI